MDSLKISSRSIDAVKPSQTVAKERDEGFVASRNDVAESKNGGAKLVKESVKNSNANSEHDSHSNVLIEQRKQERAIKQSEKDSGDNAISKLEELSVQRKLESRAAVNNQKIRNSYNALQHDNSQQKIEDMRTEKSESANAKEVTPQSTPEPINLVV